MTIRNPTRCIRPGLLCLLVAACAPAAAGDLLPADAATDPPPGNRASLIPADSDSGRGILPAEPSTIYFYREGFLSTFPGLHHQTFANPACTGTTLIPAPLNNAAGGNACFDAGFVARGLDIRNNPLDEPGDLSLRFSPGGGGVFPDTVYTSRSQDTLAINFDRPMRVIGLGLAHDAMYMYEDLDVRFFRHTTEVTERVLTSVGPTGRFIGIHAPKGVTTVMVQQAGGGYTDSLEGVYEIFWGRARVRPEWIRIASMPTPRGRLAAVYFPPNGKFYAIGGESAGPRTLVEEFDPAAYTWRVRPQLPLPAQNTGAVAIGDRIYIPGGWTGSSAHDSLQILDPVTGTVELGANLPMPISGQAVAAFGRFVHVLGGNTGSHYSDHHFIYDTQTGTWTQGAPIPDAVGFPAATSDGRHIYLLGGVDQSLDDLDHAFRYDPATDTWTELPPLTTARGAPAAWFDGSRICVAGGGWYSYRDSSECFDGSAWMPGPSMNVGTRTFSIATGGHLALKVGGWIGTHLGVTEILDIDVIFADDMETGPLPN